MWREVPQRVLVFTNGSQIDPLAVDVMNAAQLILFDHGLQVPDHRVVLEQVSHHQDTFEAIAKIDQFNRLGDVQDERLTDVHVLATLKRLPAEFITRWRRRGDDDWSDLIVGERILKTCGRAGTRHLGRKIVQARLVEITDELQSG